MRPELLAPAGDLEKLETAVRFGADAVYVGAGNYSLRAGISSLSLDDLKVGVRYAHERACKVYLALNIFAFDNDLPGMLNYFREAVSYGIDAVIVSDPGVLSLIRREATNIKIHLSTQANTCNSETVKFWANQGVSRINLARELSLEQIIKIREAVPQVELEIFMHGAMCMSYSGRCLLSKHLTGRSANRGECAQPCRWEYNMQEVNQDNPLTIEEDARGTYILNSRDLSMIEHIPELVNAGINSLKIEGRMKTPYYVGLVTKIYRQAIDSYTGDSQNYQFLPEWGIELEKVSHRPYTTGFYLPGSETEYVTDSAYIRGYDFVGVVNKFMPDNGSIEVAVRNRLAVGDTVEILDQHELAVKGYQIKSIKKVSTNEPLSEAHNSYNVIIELVNPPLQVSNQALLRKAR